MSKKKPTQKLVYQQKRGKEYENWVKTNESLKSATGYYIHLKNMHLIKNRPLNAQNKEDKGLIYSDYSKITQLNDQRRRNSLNRRLKGQYDSLFKNNISSTALQAIQQSGNFSLDDLQKELNDAIKRILKPNPSLNQELSGKEYKNLTALGAISQKIIGNYYAAAERFLKSGGAGATNVSRMKGLNDMLKIMQQVVNIFNQVLNVSSEQKEVLQNIFAVAISQNSNGISPWKWNPQAETGKKGGNSQVADIFQKMLNTLRNTKFQSVDPSYIKAIENLFQRIYTAVSTGQFQNSKDQMNAKGFVTVFQNLFISSDLLQNLQLFPLMAANNAIANGTVNVLSLNGSKHVGGEHVNALFLDDKAFNTENKSIISVQQKTDSLENLKVQLSLKGQNPQSLTFDMDIGISLKNYLSAAAVNSKSKKIFSGGTGTTLREAIQEIWKAEPTRALVYNLIARDTGNHQNLKTANKNISDLLLRHQFLRIFSSTFGTKQQNGVNVDAGDFASLIIVNGKIFTTFDLLNYIINYANKFDSASNFDNNNQAIAISIKGRTQIIKSNKFLLDPAKQGKERYKSSIRMALIRSRNLNSMINQARIEGKIHFERLDAMMNGSSNII